MTTPHVFETHSQAVRHMIAFYVDTDNYKLHKPSRDSEVFCVASKEDNLILSLLDDKTIAKRDRYGKNRGFITSDEYAAQADAVYEVVCALSQDE